MAEVKAGCVTELKNLAGILGVAIGSLALFLLYYEVHDFRPYTPRIQEIYSNMDPLDRDPPANVQDFVWNADGSHLDAFASGSLLSELRSPMKMAAWHYHSLMWDLMLKWHFDKKERVAFYCHYLPYEKGRGFASAARYYFGKSANTLDTDELATLVAIGRSPTYNSPSQHPDHLNEAKRRLLSAHELSK
jgi:hypothetical protein